jgi:hypothetical protein
MAPECCPHCGAEVSPNAKACPECGSCERTGWSDRAVADRLDLPDQEFDYDDFVRSEFGTERQRSHGLKWYYWLAAVLILLAFFLGVAW